MTLIDKLTNKFDNINISNDIILSKIINNWNRYTKNRKFFNIIKWTKNSYIKNNKKAKDNEYNWGNLMIKSVANCMWSSILGEKIVYDLVKRLGFNIWKPEKIQGYQPDFETDKYVFEVKTRNWTTSGTAGEKVLGVPYKYSDIPRLYKKPLKIILVAYQEYEYINSNTKLFGNLSEEKKKLLEYWKENNIEFIQFTKLVRLLLPRQ